MTDRIKLEASGYLDDLGPCPCAKGHGHPGWPVRSPLMRDLALRYPHFVHILPEGAWWLGGPRPPWYDHTWRERHPAGGHIYVAEPYHLDDVAFADFAWLTEQGWDVYVSANRARHYPGRTVAVWITRDAATFPGRR